MQIVFDKIAPEKTNVSLVIIIFTILPLRNEPRVAFSINFSSGVEVNIKLR